MYVTEIFRWSVSLLQHLPNHCYTGGCYHACLEATWKFWDFWNSCYSPTHFTWVKFLCKFCVPKISSETFSMIKSYLHSFSPCLCLRCILSLWEMELQWRWLQVAVMPRGNCDQFGHFPKCSAPMHPKLQKVKGTKTFNRHRILLSPLETEQTDLVGGRKKLLAAICNPYELRYCIAMKHYTI